MVWYCWWVCWWASRFHCWCRILKDQFDFRDLVARVFAFDYVGALFAALLFPLLLVPHLGLMRTSLLFGLFNVGVALWLTLRFGATLPRLRLHQGRRYLVPSSRFCWVLSVATSLQQLAEGNAYADTLVIYAQSTPYQRLVLTREPAGFAALPQRKSALQFLGDEYRCITRRWCIPDWRHCRTLSRFSDWVVATGWQREVLKYPNISRNPAG